ncbi:sugar phosphate isomerase [Alicyclobacillus cellulosilyticus]|uniref:Sugar phosphate isomerase n=1 Tax=Alicyclobacillus cellulosilyticus TaxID=1003997 RepID=A0A917K4G0_9BACL|nr:sugar phosphate isomerase/epimerase [Alicyclobacillus cellulosilyticus]GGI97832.1 sugar phosphate isomerase [Alicyclobacillus cellulosilyticus]
MPKVGVQLYTLRDVLQDDFAGTLRKVAEMGFDGVEFAGYGGYTAPQLRALCDELGLEPVSSHVPLDVLESKLDEALAYAKELGLRHIACPWSPPERRNSRAAYQALADSLNRIGTACHEAGILFSYHNHAFEFDTFDGEYGLDLLLQWTQPSFVGAELDMYWVEYAGESAKAYLRKYAGRCRFLHVKDMAADEQRSFAEVGSGSLDVPGILEVAAETGVEWLIIEQDVCQQPPLDSVRQSYAYVSRLLGR